VTTLTVALRGLAFAAMIQSAAILAGERIVDLAIPRVVASPQRVWPSSRQDGCSFTIVRI